MATTWIDPKDFQIRLKLIGGKIVNADKLDDDYAMLGKEKFIHHAKENVGLTNEEIEDFLEWRDSLYPRCH